VLPPFFFLKKMEETMRMEMRLMGAAVVAALGLFGAGTAGAQYPNKTVTLLVGFPVGGPLDIMARQIQPFMEKHLGSKIAVVNKPGAAGALMNTDVANAQPDGYTLGYLSLPGLYTILFGSTLRYDVDSFDYIGTFTNEPYTFFVHPESPYKDVKDLIARLKSAPGSVTFSAAGTGSAPHLAALLFAQVADVRINYIPAQGAAEMRNQVLGRHVDLGITAVSGSVPLVDDKQARVLGVMQAQRWEKAPAIPTFKEQGVDVTWAALSGIGAPKGLPADVKAKIYDAIQKTHADPEFRKLADRDRQVLVNMTSDQFRQEGISQSKMLQDLWSKTPWR